MTTTQLGAVVGNAYAKVQAGDGDYLDEAVAWMADRILALLEQKAELSRTVGVLGDRIAIDVPEIESGAGYAAGAVGAVPAVELD